MILIPPNLLFIYHSKQGIDLLFNFTFDFGVNIEEVTEDGPGGGFTGEIIDSYHISVCKCLSHLSACDTNPIDVGETLGVCIMTTNTDMELVNVKSLSLLQDNTAESMDVMHDSVIVNPALSELTEINPRTSFIETVVPNKFFQTTDNVAIDGAVEVQFVSGVRRLVSFRIDDTAKDLL